MKSYYRTSSFIIIFILSLLYFGLEQLFAEYASKTIEDMNTSIEQNSYLKKGKEAFKQKKYEKAISLFEKFISENNISQEAHYFLGYAYDRLSEENSEPLNINLKYILKTSECFQKVIEIDPKYEGEKIILDPYSKLTAIWGWLAYKYFIKGKVDSSIWAFIEGQSRGGFYPSILEYGKNMLASCEKNAILFTNGDMDTFPLLYLQVVENFRSDIRIVNLSLLNAGYYIKYLKDTEPKVPMSILDSYLKNPGLRPWTNQTVSIKIPAVVLEKEQAKFISEFKPKSPSFPDNISFNVQATLKTSHGSCLRVQDDMLLNIIATNRWNKPIYFSVTVSGKNLLSGLRYYLRQDGTVWKLVPFKGWNVSPNILRKNLFDVYEFNYLDDPVITYVQDLQNLYQNYRSPFIALANYEAKLDNHTNFKKIIQKMDEKIPSDIIPITNKNVEMVLTTFRIIINPSYADSIISKYTDNRELINIGESLLRIKNFKAAEKILLYVYDINPGNPRTVSLLLKIYKVSGGIEKSIHILEEWIRINPNDTNAIKSLNKLKQRL